MCRDGLGMVAMRSMHSITDVLCRLSRVHAPGIAGCDPAQHPTGIAMWRSPRGQKRGCGRGRGCPRKSAKLGSHVTASGDDGQPSSQEDPAPMDCESVPGDTLGEAAVDAGIAELDELDDTTDRSSIKLDSEGRVMKNCKLCGNSSSSASPLVPESPLQAKWGELLPWFKGCVANPVGRFCKICVSAYSVALLPSQGPLKGYMKTVSQDPSKHTQCFPSVRIRWIEQHNANPHGRVGLKNFSDCSVTVGSRQEDELQAPEEEFVTEACWAEENKDKETGVRPRRQDFPELGWHQRNFRGTMIWGYCELTGRAGRMKVIKKDTTYVVRCNVLHSGEELREGEAEAKAASARDSVLAKLGDTSRIDFDSVLRIMSGKPAQQDDNDDDASDCDIKADESIESQNPLKAILGKYGGSSGSGGAAGMASASAMPVASRPAASSARSRASAGSGGAVLPGAVPLQTARRSGLEPPPPRVPAPPPTPAPPVPAPPPSQDPVRSWHASPRRPTRARARTTRALRWASTTPRRT